MSLMHLLVTRIGVDASCHTHRLYACGQVISHIWALPASTLLIGAAEVKGAGAGAHVGAGALKLGTGGRMTGEVAEEEEEAEEEVVSSVSTRISSGTSLLRKRQGERASARTRMLAHLHVSPHQQQYTTPER